MLSPVKLDAMITPKDLVARYAIDLDIIRKFADGYSHEESLIQAPAVDGNCMNWLVGHLANSRNTILRMSGFADAQWQKYATWEQLRTRYGNGSLPIMTDGPDVLKLPQLLEGLAASQANFDKHIATLTAEQANVEIDAIGRMQPVDHFLVYMLGHEQFHIGQMEYVRPLSGKKNP